MQLLKVLKRGEPVELVDGVIQPEDVLGPTRPGRKVAILGDTCDSTDAAWAVAGADVIGEFHAVPAARQANVR